MVSPRLAAIVPLVLVLASSALGPAVLAADEPGAVATVPTVIAPEDAREHVGDEVTVEVVVKGGRKLADKEICFLNSQQDHRASDTFTAVIFRTGLARYAADGIDDPAETFRDKRVRVTGVVEERSGQAQIVVASPAQLEVVDQDDLAEEDDAVGQP